MRTILLLMVEFESPTLPLEEVAPRYFGLNDLSMAKRRAAANELPIAFFRANNKSQKCPWVCHIEDLADLIDSRRNDAVAEFAKCNNLRPKRTIH
ncbi:MAG: pyocin activator PrtN family protein [Cycloclasticus sp.]